MAEVNEELKQKRISMLQPLKNYEGMTDEEKERQRLIRQKGGLARGEQLKKAKTLKEQTQALLSAKISKEDAKRIIGDSADTLTDEDLTMQTVLLMSAFREATENGNVKAMEFLRDTSGQRPKDVLEVSADIMTDADRNLIEKVSNRLNVV